jgi:phosphoglycerate dehydrogenase-like enzyme
VEKALRRVHLGWQPDAAFSEALREGLPEGVSVTSGDDPHPETEILVIGRPSSEQMRRLTSLRAVIVPFTGVPSETVAAVRARKGVTLHNLHHNAAATAEMAIALLFAAAKRLIPADSEFRNSGWKAREQPPAVLLTGKTALVLGYGEIGRRIAESCRGLGMRVVAVSRTGRDGSLPVSSLRHALPEADALLLALPATAETEGLIGEEEFRILKPSCILVNVGRGMTVNEEALFAALSEGRIRGAGLDVWYRYPRHGADRPSNFPFERLENVVLSPHRGADVEENETLRAQALNQLLAAAARGEPIPNEVDLSKGY